MQRQDYFIKIADDIRFNAIEAIINMAHIGNIALRSALREDLQKELLSDYVFEPTFSWETAPQTLSELSHKGLLSPQLLDMIDYKITENNQNYKDKQFPRNRNPYKHQVKAWEVLLNDKKSIVITTGTGSGKTEAFMIPILNDLVSQATQSSKPLEGVQALFIYPLNALIASQKERLDAWTHQSQGKIRYCLYNGDTPEPYKGENSKNPHEVKSRTALRESPPPLLVTNISMLEYMLIRSQDQPIIQKSQGKLKWIVLDEAHSYIGSPAAELALLLRRVMQAFDVKAENIRFAAVSATIGDDENAQQALKKFLADLANISETQIKIIAGKREIPELIKKYDDNHKKYDDFLTITDEKELYTELENNSFARKFRHKIIYDTKGNFQRAISLQNIQEKYPELDNQKILQWLDLCTKAKKDDNIAFLPLRGHLHHRIMAGLWTCIDKNCSEKSEILKQSDWQFGKTYFQHRDKCDCGSPVYGLLHCQECQIEFLEAIRYDNKIIQNLPEQPDEFNIIDADDSAEADNIDNSSETNEQKSQNSKKANILISHTSYENFNEIKLHKHDKSIGDYDENGDAWLMCHTIDSGLTQCPKCDAGRKNNPALRHLYLGGAYFTSVAMPSLLSYCDNFDDNTSKLPFKGRRLITFTDSRQGTAKIATKIQQDAERQTVRGVIYHILGKETVDDSQRKKELEDEIKEIQTESSTPYNQKRIVKIQAELDAINNSIKPISWQDLSYKIANDDEFKKYIEAFNEQHRRFTGNQLADINLYREFLTRLRRYNSLETMGFVSVGYRGLSVSDLNNIPKIFNEKGKTQQDWYDFLKICLDYFFRNNKILRIHNMDYYKWMGYKSGTRLCNQKEFCDFNPKLVLRNVIRLLIHGLNLDKDNKIDQDKIKEILKTAWNFFVAKEILVKEQDSDGYYLTHEKFEFSHPKNRYLCPVTNKIIDTLFCGYTPFMPNIKNITEDTKKKYYLTDKDKIIFPDYPNTTDSEALKKWLAGNVNIQKLRDNKIWTNQHNYTTQKICYYRSEEHSAQQAKKHLKELEDGFKKGQINILNCSTTMEMGVDIGGISMVIMNNVPPHPANYLQRAGRAGRRGETRSFAFTICKNNPHDNAVFKNPDWAFITAMPKPFINFNSKPMIQRHVNACLLRYFLLNILQLDNSIRFNCKSFFVPENDISQSDKMLKWLKEGVIHNDILRNNIIEIIDNTILAKQNWQIIFDDAHRNLLDIHTDFFKDYDALQSLRETLNDDNPFKRKVDTDIKRLEKENLITYFSQHNFLPAHGFPTRIITFDTDNKNTKFQESKHEDKEDDNRYQSKGFPSRDIEVALREYAPSSDVVLNHQVYKSAGISMNWQVPANKADVSELQLFHIAWQCKQCGASGIAIESVFLGHCDYCNHKINSSDVARYLTPTGFRTDFWSDTHNDITSTSFIPAKPVQIDASYGHESLKSLPNSAIGSYISNPKGHLFLHSAGQNDNGYLLCLQCGFACDSAEEKTFDKHYNITKDGKGKCDGAIEGSFKRQELYLGYSNTTDMIEIYLKNPQSNEYITDTVICRTLALAFRKALVKKMGIQIQDIGIHTKQKKINNVTAGGFCLYDKATGGYGFSSYAPQIIIDLFKEAYENLDCPKNCQAVCYDCLLEHDCRDLLEFIDRKKTLEFYSEDFIKYVDLPPTEKILGDKTQFCPDQLNDIIISKRGINTLYVYCGGDTQYWDIVQSALKNDLLVYSKKISQIYLILDVDNIHVLTEDVKQDLYKLIFNLYNVHLGITCDKSKIIAQCDMGNHHIISYASSQDGYKDFNENWGLTNSSPLVKSDDNQKILNFKKIDKKDLQTQSDKEIEIKDKLNGLLSDFGKKFVDLLQQQYPAKFVAKLTIDNITYSDAYLCSPWYLCLLRQILTALHKEYTISDVHIISEDFKNKGNFNNQIFSNWQEAKGNYENIVLQFIKNSLKHDSVVLYLKNKNDIAHARILTIKWSDNTTTYIRFDQGMGYWACSRHHSYQDKFFDFNQTDEEQIKKLTEICDVSKIEITNQKDNPTYLFIKRG